jgi:2-amino-4-hydroxy-6-hydroxymethyldihydropteridine diphosphokinase
LGHPEPAVRAFVGLGSNLGDRAANLRRAVELLGAHPGVAVVASSRVYETAPVGPPQPDYLNAVLSLDTTLGPRALLEACLEVEQEMGRVRAERWGPRVIDLDVLTYGREVIDEPDLQVPHPRMHERAFVLVPLLELTADPMLPAGLTLARLRLPPGALAGVRPHAPALVTGRTGPPADPPGASPRAAGA